MAQSNLGIRINLDAAQAKGQVEDLSRVIADLNEKINQASKAKDWKSIAQLTQKVSDATSARSSAVEMTRQAQGGIAGQGVNYDTSQAVKNVEALDGVIARLQGHLRTAQDGKDNISAGYISKIIDNASSTRSMIMRQGQQSPTPDELIKQAEKNGDWKSAALNLANTQRQWQGATPVVPANQQSNQYLQSLPKNGDIIRQRIIVDASQAKAQVDDLDRLLVTLNEELTKATEERDWRSVASLTQSIDNVSSSRGRIMQQGNQAISQQQAQQAKEGIFGGQGAWVFQQSLNQITHGILSAWDAALSAAKQRASGDYTGAAVTEKRAKGEIAGQGWGVGIGTGVGLGLTALTGQAWLTPLLAGLGSEIGRFIGGVDAKKTEESLAYSAQYKAAMPGIDLLNQNYGGAMNRKSAEENNQYGLNLRDKAKDAAMGTGLDTESFIKATGQAAIYGIRDAAQAMNMTREQAMWSRFTGTDLGAIQKIGGQAYRYNGETNATATAYGGLMAQDMGRGQFTEYLNAIGRIMEESISKGFVKSTEEIAGNMAMMYKLSGDSPLWQGEQGAQRLSQMSNAIASATNLQSVEDVISYGAARDILGRDDPLTEIDERKEKFKGLTGGGNTYTNSYADVMQLLERGVSADLLKGQWSAVRQLDGNNTAAMIERFKTMYGLNYTGASQVWAMSRDSADWSDEKWKEAEQKIKEFQENPDYKSDSQILQDIYNKINDAVVDIGKIKLDQVEMKILDEQWKTVRDILEEAKNPKFPPQPPIVVLPPILPRQEFNPKVDREADRAGRAMDYLVTSADKKGDQAFTDYQKAYNELLKPYEREQSLYDTLMGNGNIQSIQKILVDFDNSRGKIEDEADTLERLFRNAINEFRMIIAEYNNKSSEGVKFEFPDVVHVYEQ